MLFKLTVDLAPLKAEALREIDAGAEATRGLFLTLGSGQAMVYNQKQEEALAFMGNMEISPGEVPHLHAEATRNGISMFDQAVIYLTMREQWLTVSPIIENTRLAAKEAVSQATNPAEITAAKNIAWSALFGNV